MTRRSRALERTLSFGALFLVLATLGACRENHPSSRELRLDSQVVRLPRGTQVHDVRLNADSAAAPPITVHASPGDIVRFTPADNLTHAIAFDTQALSADASAFLQRTSQLSSPPLTDTASSWVVNLDGAPPGRYPFRCLSHGRRGVLIVDGS